MKPPVIIEPHQRLKYQLYGDADLQARNNLNITPFCCDKVAIRRENLELSSVLSQSIICLSV